MRRDSMHILEWYVDQTSSLHEKIAADMGLGDRVWCRTCRREQKVDPAHCLAHGWPKCCGATMTVDSPETWSGEESDDDE